MSVMILLKKREQILGDEMLQIDVPKNKDWNDDLKEVGSLEKQKQNQITAFFLIIKNWNMKDDWRLR